METLHQFLRYVHIACGFTAFLVAPVAMIVRKGGAQHRLWGKIYFWAMIVGVSISILLAQYLSNYFLFAIGVFSFHLTFFGRRALGRKRPDKGQRATAIDYAVIGSAILVGVYLLVEGIRTGATLAIIFGIGIIAGLLPDLKKMIKPPTDRNAWFYEHIGGIVGSYIASLTAFSVTNLRFLPQLVQWLWPTIVIVPILSYVIRKYKIKFAGGKRPSDVATIKLALMPE